MWQHLAHSIRGAAHEADCSPCQDSHSFRFFDGQSSSAVVACVADGAGSSKYSNEGSAFACEAIEENAAAYFEEHGCFDHLQREDVVGWCNDARQRMEEEASQRDCGIREFASTLCAAIISPSRSFFFQIGDGAIILGQQGVYGVVFWPQSGEYANSTNFLSAKQYEQHLEFLSVSSCFSDVALFTDGLERLALAFDTQTPHPPFFEPLFQALRSTDNCAALGEDLREFLQSYSVKSRSDDDKTLILASELLEKDGEDD